MWSIDDVLAADAEARQLTRIEIENYGKTRRVSRA